MLAVRAVQFIQQDIKLALFTLALFIYALWGSPTPDAPGVIEVMIAALLVLSVGFVKPLQSLRLCYRSEKPLWHISAWFLWVFGFSVPLVFAIMSGSGVHAVLRDIAGFFFLCLPLFLFSFFENSKQRQNVLLISCLGIGLIFTLRTLYSFLPIFNQTDELLYLSNSPLVLLTTLFVAGYGSQKLFQKITLKNLIIFLICGTATAVMLLAMFADVLRASFASFALSIIILTMIGLVKAPLRMIVPILLAGLSAIIFQDFLGAVIQDIMLKTSRVGLNMRMQEWYAVWDVLSASWQSILFGQGWGSSFASPAVGGLHVTFTHSLLSYMFLKCGLFGLILCLVYLFFIFEKLARVYFSDPVKGNALFWPYLIPILLYASHKSFDFGLLLVLILVLAQQMSGTYIYKETKKTS